MGNRRKKRKTKRTIEVEGDVGERSVGSGSGENEKKEFEAAECAS